TIFNTLLLNSIAYLRLSSEGKYPVIFLITRWVALSSCVLDIFAIFIYLFLSLGRIRIPSKPRMILTLIPYTSRE
ncbi:hypothetical protein LCGC14_2179640, partial [marine sediment metagenome]